MPSRFLIIAEPNSNQALGLAAGFQVLGYDVPIVSLSTYELAPDRPNGLRGPHVEDAPPEGVFVVSMPYGINFGQMMLRLTILRILERYGAAVWNSAAVVERCINKTITSALLAAHHVSTPWSTTTTTLDRMKEIIEERCVEGASLVMKPLMGSNGRGIRRIRSPKDLPTHDESRGPYYVQQFIAPAGGRWHDFRVIVCNGSVMAAMKRSGKTWLNNISQGARPEPVEVTRELADVSISAARAIGADFLAVDVIAGEDGTLYVLETNSNPSWKGLQKAYPNLDLDREIAAAFVHAVDSAQVRIALSTSPDNNVGLRAT